MKNQTGNEAPKKCSRFFVETRKSITGMRRILWAILWLLLVFSIARPVGAAMVTSSSLTGNGRVTASVWCYPNVPPAAPSATGTAIGSFDIPGTPPTGTPLPAACNPGTFANGLSGVFWRDLSSYAAAGGDSSDSPDLLSMLTRVSFLATGSLTVTGSILDADDVSFHIVFALSDPGVGALEQWSDAITGAPLGSQMIQIGPRSGSIDVIISDPSGYANILMQTEGAAVSLPIPEPASFLLMGIGFLALSRFARKRFF